MPTGYTHEVQTGKITEFRDFAMLCARAMGACIMMRDEPRRRQAKANALAEYQWKVGNMKGIRR